MKWNAAEICATVGLSCVTVGLWWYSPTVSLTVLGAVLFALGLKGVSR